MANTITNTRLLDGGRRVVQYITLASDGTQETDTVIYDSSVVATSLGKTDPLNSRIKSIKYSTSSALGVVKLNWDATTKVLAYSMPRSAELHHCFDDIGGLKNTGGAGITGDVTLTTTGLVTGDSLVIILEIDPEYPSV